jgi:hypothetical protein
MTAAELLDVAEAERLALGPGDIVVVKCPQVLADWEAEELGSRIRTVIPAEVRLIVLDGGLDITVIKAEYSGEQP